MSKRPAEPNPDERRKRNKPVFRLVRPTRVDMQQYSNNAIQDVATSRVYTVRTDRCSYRTGTRSHQTEPPPHAGTAEPQPLQPPLMNNPVFEPVVDTAELEPMAPPTKKKKKQKNTNAVSLIVAC